MKVTSTSRKIFVVLNTLLMLFMTVIAIFPFLNQLAISFSSSQAIMEGKVSFFPIGFNIVTYQDILKGAEFWINYKNTLVYTLIGTAVGLTLTTMAAYALSKKNVVGKKPILFIFVFTMFFGGGLIPTYLLYRTLSLTGSMWAIILNYAILPYHILLMKTYFESLPEELEDASKIDGLSQFGYFIKVAIPLSKPIIATMILFIAVIYWNDWFAALIYLDDKLQYPVTIYLRNALVGANIASQSGGQIDASAVRKIPQSIQAASMLLVAFPIICVYPFVQKHFTKGIMLGAIKG